MAFPTHSAFDPSAARLELRGLRKSFDAVAVDGIDLTVKPGEFYALLGPNGAGKSTTLRIAAGLLRPDAGEVRICGIDAVREPAAAKSLAAWVPDEPMIYDKLTPEEYLAFVAGLWGVEPSTARERGERLLDRLGLWPQRAHRCEGFSRGMKQKVALAGALVHEPLLLLLDEPLTGLDAAAARLVRDLLREQVQAGCAIVLTTHILQVAERMADRIGIIASGRLIAEGGMDELRAQTDAGDGGLEDIFLALTAAPAGAA